jgi:hypothetical protein
MALVRHKSQSFFEQPLKAFALAITVQLLGDFA